MAHGGANRFALFAENDDQDSSPPASPAANDALATDFPPLDSNESPWQDVKNQGAKPQKASVLIIRNTNPKPTAAKPNEKKSNSHSSGDRQLDETRKDWCGICSVKFSSKIALQNHMKQNARHENYCNLCRRVFKDRNGLRNHRVSTPGHDIFCNICFSAFNNENGLKNHFQNLGYKGHSFFCDICLLGFDAKARLDDHRNSASAHVRCDTCHRKFNTEEKRDHHWRTTNKHKHCLQPGCKFDGPDSASLEKHLSEAHFRCPVCREVFQSSTRLNVHTYNGCPFGILCNNCQKIFPDQKALDQHHKVECFRCSECQHWTDNEETHLKHQSGHSQLAYKCWICAEPMLSLTHVITHLETGECFRLPDAATHLLRVLGKWWYSVLYMEISEHVQIRQGRADMKVMGDFIEAGTLKPFICRAEGCGEKFGRLNLLIDHVERGTCKWTLETLRLDQLEHEFLHYLGETDLFKT